MNTCDICGVEDDLSNCDYCYNDVCEDCQRDYICDECA